MLLTTAYLVVIVHAEVKSSLSEYLFLFFDYHLSSCSMAYIYANWFISYASRHFVLTLAFMSEADV